MDAGTLVPVLISFGALVVSGVSLGTSIYIWKRSFRPIVTVAVRTSAAGNVMTAYDLVIVNSGEIPARDIMLKPKSQALLEAALGKEGIADKKRTPFACFNRIIPVLLNGDKTTGEFGNTKANDTGFWKHKSKIGITIIYSDLFGRNYKEQQDIEIFTSNTFSGYSWGDK